MQTTSPIRTLSLEEKESIERFITIPLKHNQFYELRTDQVYTLSGRYVKKEFKNSSGITVVAEYIDDIQVLIPYGGHQFLQKNNRVEVAFTCDDLAIVVRLNDSFFIREAYEKTRFRNFDLRKYQSLADLEENRCLGKRTESLLEKKVFQNYSRGYFESFLIAISAVLFLSASKIGWFLFSFLFALIVLAGIAGWFFQRSKKRSAGEVNQIEGVLTYAPVIEKFHSPIYVMHFFLGNHIPLKIPLHWQDYLLKLSGKKIYAEVRVRDHALLSVNHERSIELEEQYFRSRKTHWQYSASFLSAHGLSAKRSIA